MKGFDHTQENVEEALKVILPNMPKDFRNPTKNQIYEMGLVNHNLLDEGHTVNIEKSEHEAMLQKIKDLE